MKKSASNVRVVARIRPLAEYEIKKGSQEIVTSLIDHGGGNSDTGEEPELVQADVGGQKRWFELDAVFDKSCSQRELYERSGAQASVTNSLFKGFNCTILAYGQTGAGKSYSMGSATNNRSGEEIEEGAGIIPRACVDLFTTIRAKCDGNAEVRLSYLEIYNEELRDLLVSSDADSSKLKIRETLNGEVYVSGLQSRVVASPHEIGQMMEEASTRRVTASTAMNAVSSRSHAMCILSVKGVLETDETFESKLTLVDLAGSERIKKTGAMGSRQKEGININKSLLVLGQVVSALSSGGGKSSRKPPYRDSKLTRLLQDSLGGNSQTIMVACVSPAEFNIDESVNTLRYATSARNIQNKATRNLVQHVSAEEAQRLLRDNQLLKGQIQELQKTIALLASADSVSRTESTVSDTASLDDEPCMIPAEINNNPLKDNAVEINNLGPGCPSVESLSCEELQAEVTMLRKRQNGKVNLSKSASQAAIEVPALKAELERMKEQVKNSEQLEEENNALRLELDESKADAHASQQAAAKLSGIMDKLQELKSDEIDKKRTEYEHTKKEEAWVLFLSQMLLTRREEMQRLGDDFDLVVRVVESTAMLEAQPGASQSTERDSEKPWNRFMKRKEEVSERTDANDGAHDIRQVLLKQHVTFFNDKMEEIRKTIFAEEESLRDIQSHLRKDRERLEADIGLNEFVKDSLNSQDEDLLRKLTSVLIGPVQQV